MPHQSQSTPATPPARFPVIRHGPASAPPTDPEPMPSPSVQQDEGRSGPPSPVGSQLPDTGGADLRSPLDPFHPEPYLVGCLVRLYGWRVIEPGLIRRVGRPTSPAALAQRPPLQDAAW